ncbi:MAG: LamG domain-containing protein, partial [Saccharospirillaceae bacterium]|nr:LamG domain-containing protein [Pseudomonadales bacterium]NRB81179.1 LamG domain-containing protein [Saccharospirillaceae bacterium]
MKAFKHIIFFILLSLFSSFVWSDNSQSCMSIFDDVIGTVDGGGDVNLGFNTNIYGNPDGLIASTNLTTSTTTCDGGPCVSTSTKTPLTIPNFQTSPGGANITLNSNITHTFDGSVLEHNELISNGAGFFEFLNPSNATYKIKTLQTNYAGGVIFAPGDYYIEDFNVGVSNQISVSGSGTVRLFIKNAFTPFASSKFNTNVLGSGDASKLVIIAYDNVDFSNATWFTGYLYSAKDIVLNNMFFYGSLAASNIVGYNNIELHYEDPSLNNADFGELCSLDSEKLIAQFTFDELVSGNYADTSGNGYTGIPAALSQINASGQICSAVQTPWDSTADFVGVTTDIDSSVIAEKGSVALWVKLDSDWDYAGDRRSIIYAKKGIRIFDVEINAQGRLKIEFEDDANNIIAINTSKTFFVAGDWHHIVYAWDFTSSVDVQFYIDGSLVTSSVSSGSDPWVNFTTISEYDEIYLFDKRAGDSNPKFSVDGLADELNIYNYPIDSTEVTRLYNETRGTCPTTTVVVTPTPTSCGDTFGDAVGTTGTGGNLTLGTDATIFNSPDNLIFATGISLGGGNTRPTCSSSDCTITNNTMPTLTLPAFQTQSGGASTYKYYGEDIIFDGSVTDHDTISAGGAATITFDSPVGGVYRINQLTINYDSTINLAPGDYFINNYAINGLVTINITGSGSVRLFVNNSFTVGDLNTINTPSPGTGDPGKFILVGYNNMTLSSGSIISGYVYVAGDVFIYSPSSGPTAIYGSIAAQNVSLSANAELHFVDPTTSVTTPNFADICPTTAAVVTPTIDHFDFSFNSVGSTCSAFPSAITITAKDASNVTITDYTGSMDLSTTSNHGTWTINNANGTLSDITTDDGAATYSFLTSDLGIIVLDLENNHADNQIISAIDTTASVSSNSAIISFADNVFLVEPDSVQIAGKPVGVSITLIQTDPSNNQCGIATDYNQNKIKAWYDPIYLMTGQSTPRLNNVKLKDPEPNSSNETFGFINGVANIEISNDDIGQFELYIKDEVSGYALDTDGSELDIVGQSGIITLLPFALAMDFDNDSNSSNFNSVDHNGSVFKKVDEDFTLTVTPVLWESADDSNNDGLPDNGADLSDNDDIPSFDTTNESIEITVANLLPAGGVTGTLSGVTSSSNYSSDSHDYSLSYSEVGIITLTASITNNGFLNSGYDAASTINNVGRFIPDHFSVTTNSVNLVDALTACSITYQGQSITLDDDLKFTFSALDSTGNPVLNYAGDFNKFSIIGFAPSLKRTVASLVFGSEPNVIWQTAVMSDQNNYDGDWVITMTPSSIL